MTAIFGNTYPVKDRLKALGAKWDADRKAWIVADDKAQAAQALVAPKPVTSEKLNVGGFAGVVELFKRAQANLKYPKIVLKCMDETVILSLAGAASKTPGSINVAGEGQFPNRKWFGRVDASGAWEPSRSVSPEMLDALRSLLSELAADPAGVAQAHGKLTGNCCFCHKRLTDEKHSVKVGFGPTCARKWGLEDQWKAAANLAAVA